MTKLLGFCYHAYFTFGILVMPLCVQFYNLRHVLCSELCILLCCSNLNKRFLNGIFLLLIPPFLFFLAEVFQSCYLRFGHQILNNSFSTICLFLQPKINDNFHLLSVFSSWTPSPPWQLREDESCHHLYRRTSPFAHC